MVGILLSMAHLTYLALSLVLIWGSAALVRNQSFFVNFEITSLTEVGKQTVFLRRVRFVLK